MLQVCESLSGETSENQKSRVARYFRGGRTRRGKGRKRARVGKHEEISLEENAVRLRILQFVRKLRRKSKREREFGVWNAVMELQILLLERGSEREKEYQEKCIYFGVPGASLFLS